MRIAGNPVKQGKWTGGRIRIGVPGREGVPDELAADGFKAVAPVEMPSQSSGERLGDAYQRASRGE